MESIVTPMAIFQKKCVPCEGGVSPLSAQVARSYHTEVPHWKLQEKSIAREFIFKDFSEAMDFVNKVAKIANEENHHPDIHIFYNKVSFELTTHAIDGLSENDFIMAAKIDRLVEQK